MRRNFDRFRRRAAIHWHPTAEGAVAGLAVAPIAGGAQPSEACSTPNPIWQVTPVPSMAQ